MHFCKIFDSTPHNLHVFSPFFIKNTQKVDSDSELEKRVSSKNGVRIIFGGGGGREHHCRVTSLTLNRPQGMLTHFIQ